MCDVISFCNDFLGQLQVPGGDVLSSSNDAGDPVRPLSMGSATNSFEMSPLLTTHDIKDSVITLDYVSIIVELLQSWRGSIGYYITNHK